MGILSFKPRNIKPLLEHNKDDFYPLLVEGVIDSQGNKEKSEEKRILIAGVTHRRELVVSHARRFSEVASTLFKGHAVGLFEGTVLPNDPLYRLFHRNRIKEAKSFSPIRTKFPYIKCRKFKCQYPLSGEVGYHSLLDTYFDALVYLLRVREVIRDFSYVDPTYALSPFKGGSSRYRIFKISLYTSVGVGSFINLFLTIPFTFPRR